MSQFTGVLGIAVLVCLMWGCSTARGRVPWRLVAAGVALQYLIAWLMLEAPAVSGVFDAIAAALAALIGKADAGIEFLFGPQLTNPAGPAGFVFAVRVLPVIIFFSALMSVLYYVGLMQLVVGALAWLLKRALGVSGAEALCMASNVFLGQTEAPLTVRPYLAGMTRAQLMTVMTGGFGTVAGSVFGAYVSFLSRGDEAQAALYAKHLLVASVISAPACFVASRLLLPETQSPPEEPTRRLMSERRGDHANLFDAVATGATDGLKLALNVAAMLIAFIALIAVADWPLRVLSDIGSVKEWREARGIEPFSLSMVLGWLMAPLAWLTGVPWRECSLVGGLLGERLIATELVAYKHLADMTATVDPQTGEPVISSRSAQITAYSLCGFANFASIGIQIGGLSALAPERRKDFASIAMRAMIGGTLATIMTGSVVSVFIR